MQARWLLRGASGRHALSSSAVMAVSEMKVDIKLAWWLIPYLKMLGGMYRCTGYYPHAEHVVAVWKRGVKLEIA